MPLLWDLQPNYQSDNLLEKIIIATLYMFWLILILLQFTVFVNQSFWLGLCLPQMEKTKLSLKKVVHEDALTQSNIQLFIWCLRIILGLCKVRPLQY